MALEDVPEMELTEGDYKDEFGINTDVNGKFVVFSGPNSRSYVLAVNHCHRHEEIREIYLIRALESHGCANLRSQFNPTGGGSLFINADKIQVYGRSTNYGKYDEQIVRPIIERFAQEHFPEHELSLK